MPHFSAPAYLLLALAIPPLLWLWWRQRRRSVRHPVAGLLASLPSRRARLARATGAVLRGGALLLLVLALAGPRWPDLRTRIRTEGIALCMVVDVSGSMGERDFESDGLPLSRLEAVRKAFRLFVEGGEVEGVALEGRPTDLIGLVTFATRPEATCPLTLSHTAVLRLLDEQEPRNTPGESQTNLSEAIAIGLHKLKAAGPRRKVMVLLTDGEHNVANTPSGWTPRQAAQVAAGLGVPVYTIDAGPAPGAPAAANVEAPSGSSPEVREQAEKTLKEIASLTGGRYFTARDTHALVEACRTIDQLERTTIQSFQYRRYHEGYPWLALGGLGLFVLALGLERTIWRRLP